jgi:hypothetical protein
VPFSDPTADGPVIQRAGLRALAHRTSLRQILELVAELRRGGFTTPIILFGYYNPIFHYGPARLVDDAQRAGIDGLLVVDLPPDEADELWQPARAAGLDVIFLLAPTSDRSRVRAVVRKASGFVYFVSMTGVTGSKAIDADDPGRDGVDLHLVHFHDRPDGQKNPSRPFEIVLCRARPARNRRRRLANRGRRIRHRSHEPRLSLLFHARHAYSRRERNDQFVPSRRSDSCHHVQNDARLYPDQNYFRLLCDPGVLCGYKNSQLLAQRRPRDLLRLTQDDFGRRAKLGPHQAAHDRTRQLASADKAEPIPPVVGL